MVVIIIIIIIIFVIVVFCMYPGADEQELATPILSLCHGILTD